MKDQKTTAWIINGLLAVILVLLAGYYLNSASPAYAGPGWDTDGIMAVPAVDLDHLILVDTRNKNICIYAMTGNMFRLVGARSYEYDTEVEDSAGKEVEHGQGMTWMKMRDLYNAQTKKP